MGNIILELKPDHIMSATLAEKRAAAIAYLRSKNLYVLDKNSIKPKWGNGKKEEKNNE